ncbi:hotdog domain-containing protein [Phytohabitans sp. ZYX-F-186]|uniref:Hotdog domain-containing protein n=1 Tax=Phytohabitans maris TaxID=3071409 RepID=A0ABU0ZIK0_9ACTN|nr:thioesterase family protein [Phytohabitans sp. ZYX-F-186]MDQ7906835.1 hotdog domain-containing protein [Phytohabitans sp. ZYX-F-186]
MTHTALAPAPFEVDYGHVEPIAVYFDDHDPMGIVHNARYPVLLERAITPYWTARGHYFDHNGPSTPDLFHAVREFSITYHRPIRGAGEVLVHFWLDTFGETSARYGFRFLSSDGRTCYAEGHRAIVRLDQVTLRPTPWTEAAREVALPLLKPERSLEPEEVA